MKCEEEKRVATERSHYLVMDFITLFFLFSAFFTASAQQIQSNVSRSSSLTPTTNSTWLSRSSLYAFGFYKQGNGYAVGIFMAGIPAKTVVWTANRDDPPVSGNATLIFASDGRLVLQMGQEQVAVVAESSGSASASMLNSGNFVIYNSDQGIIWQSFDYPTDTLLPSQRSLTHTTNSTWLSRSSLYAFWILQAGQWLRCWDFYGRNSCEDCCLDSKP
jgi:hypothetical protein